MFSQHPGPLTGGCHCGSNRYAIPAPTPILEIDICCCHTCQRLSGSASLPFFNIAAVDLLWEKRESVTEIQASEHATRTFCNRCGTPLTMVYKTMLEVIFLTCGSLDPDSWDTLIDGPKAKARRIFTGEKAKWETWAWEGEGGEQRGM